MILAIVTIFMLMGICLLLHYEALRLISLLAPRLTFLPLRMRMLAVMGGIVLAHIAEICVFACAYYLLDRHFDGGGFAGQVGATMTPTDYLYFSTVSYTTLGLGDIYPTGGLRLITGVEALLGLLTIAWSASFAYLMMVDLWPLHGKKRGL
ncbi:MAG: two pore domain potassium channel family protein [Alphaproteobacteria bacterium]|jgi:hypothetical protein|nr:two pore domain potassium channel family protein [Alphaproteobacteria bacterium]